MLIPIGTDRPLRRPPLVTPVLIGLNVAIFLVQAVLQRNDPEGFRQSIDPLLISRPNFQPWQLVSYAFLHADWLHVLGNMVALWVFGPNVEDRYTRLGFLGFYLAGGAAAGAAHIFTGNNPALGASGAVAAVTGAYIVLFPRTNIRCIVFMIIIGMFNIPAWVFIAFAIAKDIVFAGISHDNVARMAHLGGYGWGISLSLVLLATRVFPREPFDLFTIGRQAYRRRQLKEATVDRERRDSRAPLRQPAAARPPSPEDEALGHARAAVAAHMSRHDLPQAATAYKLLVERHAANPQACTLSRRHQVDLANHFFSTADHEAAAYAYQRFLDAYPRDPEGPHVRLLLALINARYLNDPVRARQLLAGLPSQLPEGEQRTLAETLTAELG